MLDIGRALREEGHLYDPSWQQPHVARPIVPRHLRRTVRERTMVDGTILQSLDEEELQRIVAAWRRDGVDAIAVCFLNSYINPTNEERARHVILETWPDIRVYLSSEVAPVSREYDRGMTLALNAYVAPLVSQYLERLELELGRRGYGHRIYTSWRVMAALRSRAS